jgi:hypothetical protein
MVSEIFRQGNSRKAVCSVQLTVDYKQWLKVLAYLTNIYTAHCILPTDSMIISIAMRIRIFSNDVEGHLTPFIGKFLGNVCAAITASLKTPQPIKAFKYELEGEMVRIFVNQIFVPLDLSQGFSRIIILDTIRGMIRHLKLADPEGVIRIEVDMETEP